MFCELEQPGIKSMLLFLQNPSERVTFMVRDLFEMLMNAKAFSPENACILTLSYWIYVKISQWVADISEACFMYSWNPS